MLPRTNHRDHSGPAVDDAPNSTHVPLSLAALAAGQAVVVDKPMASTAEEARRVIAEARRRGLFLSVYHQRRWDSDTLTVRRLIVDGLIGDVVRGRGGRRCFLALTHTSSVRSHLWASAVGGHLGPRVRVLGTRAAYVKRDADGQEAALRAGLRPDRPDWGVEGAARWGVLSVGGETRPVPSEPGAYQRYYAGVVASLQQAPPPGPSIRKTR